MAFFSWLFCIHMILSIIATLSVSYNRQNEISKKLIKFRTLQKRQGCHTPPFIAINSVLTATVRLIVTILAFVKGRVEGIEVLGIQPILRHPQRFTETGGLK